MSRAPAEFRMKGFTMIEILVALLILAVGLLGLAGLQSRAHQAELESFQRAQALLLAEDMANRLNANRNFDSCYDLVGRGVAYVGTGGAAPVGCNAQAESDLNEWHQQLLGQAELLNGQGTGAMLGARGCIQQTAPSFYRISIAWQGIAPTFAPQNNDCAQGLYGDEKLRRVISIDVRIANLS